MPLEHKNNLEEKKLTLNFSNGAYQQLEDLQNAYNLDDIAKVVEIAINILDIAKDKKIILEDKNGNREGVKISK